MVEAVAPMQSRRLPFWAMVVALVISALGGVFALLWFKLPTWAPQWVVEYSPWVDPVVRGDLAKESKDWSTKSEIRKLAVDRLQSWGPAAIPEMIKCLEHESPVVRSLAAETLRKFKDERVARALAARLRLNNQYEEPYRAIMVALVKQDPVLVTDLILPFPTANDSAAIWSLETAARIADQRLVPAMRDIVWEPEQSQIQLARDVRESGGRWVLAAWALACSPDPSAIPALLPAFIDPVPVVRYRAMEGVARLYKRTLDPRLAEVVRQGLTDPERTVRWAALSALHWSEIAGTEESLIRMASVAHPLERRLVISALATSWTTQRAVDQVASMLFDDNLGVRVDAFRALRSARRIPSISKLRELLPGLPVDMRRDLFRHVASFAGKGSSDQPMADLLLDLAESSESETCSLANEALGAFGLTEEQRERWDRVRIKRTPEAQSPTSSAE